MIPANEALNFIMVIIIIKNGFQVDVEIGGYLRKMISHPTPAFSEILALPVTGRCQSLGVASYWVLFWLIGFSFGAYRGPSGLDAK